MKFWMSSAAEERQVLHRVGSRIKLGSIGRSAPRAAAILTATLASLFTPIFARTPQGTSAASALTASGNYQDMAVRLLQQYIRINTSNPPGNELAAAEFFHRLFDAAHIPNKIYLFAPGRADIYAVVKGDGSRRPIVLLNHMDTVEATPAGWRAPPFSGEILNGMIYGRGAMDMKDMGIMEAVACLRAAQLRPKLKRDIVFLGTGDEEVSSAGSEWLLKHHPELVRNAEYMLTEGGANILWPDGHRIYGIDVAEKAPLWLRLTAHGEGGHGSVPIADSAPNQLARALARVANWQPPPRLIPAAAAYFKAIAPDQPAPLAREFRRIQKSMRNPSFVHRISRRPEWNILVRDTVSITEMRAGAQTNVIPAEASASLDARLLPGSNPAVFIRRLRAVIGNNSISIKTTAPFRPPNASPEDTGLYRVIENAVRESDPAALVAPTLNSGYTECQLYRPLGIACYGFTPVLVTPDIEASQHAPNERVPEAQIRRGVQLLYQIVTRSGG